MFANMITCCPASLRMTSLAFSSAPVVVPPSGAERYKQKKRGGGTVSAGGDHHNTVYGNQTLNDFIQLINGPYNEEKSNDSAIQ